MKPTIDELKNLYETERLTQYQIAKRLGVDQPTICKLFKEYGIKKLPKNTLTDAKPCIRPNRETVLRLYETDRLTTRQIGNQFNVSKTEVLRWLRFYNIPPRAANNGLANRGILEPTKEELTNLIHTQHLGYREIAAIYNVDCTAIPYWLKKHDISRPKAWDTRYKGNKPVLPTEDELRVFYNDGNGMSLVEIGALYGVSELPIKRLCLEYGITIKPDGFNGGRRYECEDGHLVRSVYEQRVDNWLYQHGIKHSIEPRLPFNKHCKADFFANGWYIEVWGVTQNKAYTERRKRKTQGYQSHNLPLIELEVHYFQEHRNKQWERKLKKVLEPPFIAATLLDFE